MSTSCTAGVSLELAGFFFQGLNVGQHALEMFAKHPPLRHCLQDHMNSLCNLIWWKESYQQRLAREAVGNFFFHHPAALTEYMGFSYSEDALQRLWEVPFPPELLRQYQITTPRMMLVADPGLSILDMRKLFPQEFQHQHHYEDWKCVSRREEPRWVLISPERRWSSKDFAAQDEERNAARPRLCMASARQQVLALLLERIIIGTYFNGIVRTSETVLTREGLRRVTVGYGVHEDRKISLDTWEDRIADDRIGLGVARVEPDRCPPCPDAER